MDEIDSADSPETIARNPESVAAWKRHAAALEDENKTLRGLLQRAKVRIPTSYVYWHTDVDAALLQNVNKERSDMSKPAAMPTEGEVESFDDKWLGDGPTLHVLPVEGKGESEALVRLRKQIENAHPNHKTMFVYVDDLRQVLATPPAPRLLEGAVKVKGLSDDEFEMAARTLVPFAYGAFEQHGSDTTPFEPGKPNANCYNATRAILSSLSSALY